MMHSGTQGDDDTLRRSSIPLSQKVELVLRMLRGEHLPSIMADSGRSRSELRKWRATFLSAGEAGLAAGAERLQRSAERNRELQASVDELSQELQRLRRRMADTERDNKHRATKSAQHPLCSEEYAAGMVVPGVEVSFVPEWNTHVLIRKSASGAGSRASAQGMRPWASIDPASELLQGLERIRDHGVASLTLVTDPLWSPDVSALQLAFPSCRPFKECFLVDRAIALPQPRKRHRNRINQARRLCAASIVPLREHLSRWWELYQHHANDSALMDSFSREYFTRLAENPHLITIAVREGESIIGMSLWLLFNDTAYLHDAASDERGFACFATHLGYAEAIRRFADQRFVCFGGGGGIRDDPEDGLAEFKRGFANASRMSYFCTRLLN